MDYLSLVDPPTSENISSGNDKPTINYEYLVH